MEGPATTERPVLRNTQLKAEGCEKGIPSLCRFFHFFTGVLRVVASRDDSPLNAGLPTVTSDSGAWIDLALMGYLAAGRSTGCASRNSSRDSLGIESC